MGQKIIASRISSGNKIFPPSIMIEDRGLTIKFPGFFNGSETFVEYDDISSISIDSRLIGFTTIRLIIRGSDLSIHGFTSSDATIIKQAIKNGQSKTTK